MKYLIKIYFLLIALNVFGQTMYEAPKNNNYVLSVADLPVEYSTGIPDIGIELFNVQTIDPNYSLDFNLKYDLYSNTSIYYSTQQIGDAWRLPVLPMITRHQGQVFTSSDVPLTDEMYYEVTPNTNQRDKPDIYSYDIFGLTGRFYLKRENNQFKIIIIDQNDYAKIEFTQTPIIVDQEGHSKYKTKSFKITDKNGYVYDFNTYDYFDMGVKDSNDQPILYPYYFYLSSINNKYGTTLCDYTYTDLGNVRRSSLATKFFYKKKLQINEIDVNKIGKIKLSLDSNIKKTITLNNIKGQILKHIELNCIGAGHTTSNGNDLSNSKWVKSLLRTVNIYSKDLSKKQTYTLDYNLNKVLQNSFTNHSGFLIREDECNNISHLYKENLYFDYGVLNRITNPMEGFTIYEFEPNDFFIRSFDGSTNLDVSNIDYYRNNNSENFTLENIPLTHDPLSNRYTGNLSLITNSNYNKIFVNYDARPYESDPLRPNIFKFPLLKVYHFTPSSNFGYLLQTLNKRNVICEFGYQFNISNTSFISLEYDAGMRNLYTSITAKVLKYKPDSELQKFSYGHGLRIKKIKYYDKVDPDEGWNQGIINLPATKEVTYNYRFFHDSKASSGYTINPRGFSLSPFADILDLIYYENVSVETTGLGKIEFSFMNPNIQVSYTQKKLPTKIVKKDESGNIVEENVFTRTFKEFNPNASGINKQPIITYEKVINRNYVNGNSTPLELITESRFDTISRNLTSKKIINSLLNETFEEQYTYVKHNDSYLPKTVNKFKNGVALNRSENIYAIKKCSISPLRTTSIYNLYKTQIAKADLPLEIENEYTDYSCDGKLLEYKTKDGVYVSQIWGYNGAFVIAELHNIRYTEIDQQILTNLISASNLTDLNYNENNIRNFVDNLRTAHPDVKIKSYTFNPLVGMTSMTDVNGRDEFYEYDIFNRLYRIKDHSGLILKEYNYNYKN